MAHLPAPVKGDRPDLVRPRNHFVELDDGTVRIHVRVDDAAAMRLEHFAVRAEQVTSHVGRPSSSFDLGRRPPVKVEARQQVYLPATMKPVVEVEVLPLDVTAARALGMCRRRRRRDGVLQTYVRIRGCPDGPAVTHEVIRPGRIEDLAARAVESELADAPRRIRIVGWIVRVRPAGIATRGVRSAEGVADLLRQHAAAPLVRNRNAAATTPDYSGGRHARREPSDEDV